MFELIFVSFVELSQAKKRDSIEGTMMNANKTYRSVDEIDRMDFKDCTITDAHFDGDDIRLDLEALIIRANNSQNENYTDSYAGETRMRLEHGRIMEVVKEGYRYYNADNELIREVPDEKVEGIGAEDLSSLFAGSYLAGAEVIEPGVCRLFVETVSEEDHMTASDSYRIQIAYEHAVFTWDRYLNRVQQ